MQRPIFFVQPMERIRRERRERLKAFWVSVAALLALAAMTGWLLWIVTNVAAQTWRLGDLETGRLVAMAPTTTGAILGLLFFFVIVLVMMAVAKVKEDAVFYAELRRHGQKLEPQDPFAGITDGLDGDEMHRILTSCAAEGREIKRLVKSAQRTRSVEDYEDALNVAHDRLTTLIACVEALCERLQPCIDEEDAA